MSDVFMYLSDSTTLLQLAKHTKYCYSDAKLGRMIVLSTKVENSSLTIQHFNSYLILFKL